MTEKEKDELFSSLLIKDANNRKEFWKILLDYLEITGKK